MVKPQKKPQLWFLQLALWWPSVPNSREGQLCLLFSSRHFAQLLFNLHRPEFLFNIFFLARVAFVAVHGVIVARI